jgi:hypothetical protein
MKNNKSGLQSYFIHVGRVIMILAIGATLLSSCDIYTTREKQETYYQISKINDSLDRETKEWHHLLEVAIKTKNYSALMPYRTNMGRFLSESRERIGKLKVNPNSGNLIDSEEVYLEHQADVVSELYSVFEAYNEETPPLTIEEQLKPIANDMNYESTYFNALKKSLAYFARRNKIKIK